MIGTINLNAVDAKKILDCNLDLFGSLGDSRKYVIEEAIKLIQDDPENALAKNYLGIKNYAACGDQRADCEYGYSPKHGSIVFSIGRKKRDKPLGENDVYALEVWRDAGMIENPFEKIKNRTDEFQIVSVISAIRTANEMLSNYHRLVSNIEKACELVEFQSESN